MPQLAKRHIAQFIRRGCKRRLRFDLYAKDPELEVVLDAAGTLVPNPPPKREVARPGLQVLRDAGRAEERERYQELERVFAGRVLVPEPGHLYTATRQRDTVLLLSEAWRGLGGVRFLVEAEYEVPRSVLASTGAEQAILEALANRPLQQRLTFGAARPDILQVMGPAHLGAGGEPNAEVQEVLPDGEVRPIGAGDGRLGIRVIDCKLAAEPSQAHFAEVAFYCITLSAWLREHLDEVGDPLSRRFFVRTDAAVWLGKHCGSAMDELEDERRREDPDAVPTEAEYLQAFERDLEFLPKAVFMTRIRQFLRADLPQVLAELRWQTLDWHVDSRCLGCEYLGYRWLEDGAAVRDPSRATYCIAEAQRRGHLSRLAGLSTGARKVLDREGVGDCAALAQRPPSDGVYERHQALRAARAVMAERARALGRGDALLVPDAGGTALLPKHADVSVKVVVEFDPASAITAALAWRVDYARRMDGADRPVTQVQVVRRKNLGDECEALLHMLGDIRQRLVDAQQMDWRRPDGSRREPTMQVYVWDRITYEHLRRIVGRHLGAIVQDGQLRDLAWLFPPESVLPDQDHISLRSPLSVVSDTFRSLVAADLPHHYSLLGAARLYHPGWVADRGMNNFRVDRLFEDPFSDYVPAERIHELWLPPEQVRLRNQARQRRACAGDRVRLIPNPQNTEASLRRVMETKTFALGAVTSRLAEDLRPSLRAEAPSIREVVIAPRAEGVISRDGLVWLEHARLQASAATFENDALRAMTPEQREARFESARVVQRLEGPERAEALRAVGIQDVPGRLVLRLHQDARDVKMKVGDFYWSLLPCSLGHLQYATVAQLASLPEVPPTMLQLVKAADSWKYRQRLFEASKVTIVGLDRARGLVAVDPDTFRRLGQEAFVTAALRTGFFPLARDAGAPEEQWGVLDPVAQDFATARIRAALRGIGNPPLAARPLMEHAAIVRPARGPRGANATAPTPVDAFVWAPLTMWQASSPFDPRPGLGVTSTGAGSLTDRQRQALEASLGRRLALLWGPPGTGKTRTAQAILACLSAWSAATGRRVRALVTGPTWTAIDTVAAPMPAVLEQVRSDVGGHFSLHRLVSSLDGEARVPPGLVPHRCSADLNDSTCGALLRRLSADTGFTLVASTPHQVAKLVAAAQGDPRSETLRAELFDFVLVDEASQMDVAHALMAFTGLAEGASVTVVGDDLQMPPIHPVPPPKGLEAMVGSIYGFYREHPRGAVDPVMLDLNYRSNEDIVGFVRSAGYRQEFRAHYPRQRLGLCAPLPTGEDAPAGWPAGLEWSPEWARLLDPTEPLVAVVHGDDTASQRNEAEAHAVAALVATLWGRLGGLEYGPPDSQGNGGPMPLRDFLSRGVGVVTPHRAQQAAVVDRLLRSLPPQDGHGLIFDAVDTVERFQGQERMVIIATLGLGDLDQIRLEEEFLYSLRRFNVIASRAQAKLVVLVSRTLLDHIPGDSDMMRQSGLLKDFADGFLRRSRLTALPGFVAGVEVRTR